MMKEHELGGQLLAGVSRSFYLTLKALPEGLREPISLGYLLARTADTMADTAAAPETVRAECLREFDRLVQSAGGEDTAEAALYERLRGEFIPHQTDESEAALLGRLPEIFRALRTTPPHNAAHIRSVLAPITRGQLLDLERFPGDGRLHALSTADELDEYTYLVAGCVGGFWTKLCAEASPPVLSGQKPMDEMLVLGIRYGKGLQLVNILRDVGKDLAMGRCYFPLEELQKQGLTLGDVQANPSRLLPVMAPWRILCREHLACGAEYLKGLKSGRLAYATALPLLLGIRTLARVEKADWDDLARGVKVPRTVVAKVMFDAGVAAVKKDGILKLAEKFFSSH
jgi:farnesyl-diphosphate farnesyltransferase